MSAPCPAPQRHDWVRLCTERFLFSVIMFVDECRDCGALRVVYPPSGGYPGREIHYTKDDCR